MIRPVLALILALGTPAAAFELTLPNAVITKSETMLAGSVRVPKSPWSGQPTTITEGQIDRHVLRISQPELTTLQLIQPLRAQLKDSGYQEIFTCADASCGGFDFRFQLDLLPAPDMYVDLGDYRYLLMAKPGSEPHTFSIVASRSRSDGFVHVTQIYDASFPDPVEVPVVTNPTPDTQDPNGITEALTKAGHAALDDLVFETGSVDLGDGPYSSLQALSLWLDTNPTARVVFVGHTDSVGSLDANINLSRRRALAVVNHLTSEFGTDAAQLEAAGAGYLAPIASNLLEEGRATNRRVEVVLLSID